LLENLDADITLANGIVVGTGGGVEVITNAINVSDADIVNALIAGANNLSGTNWLLSGASGNFDIEGTFTSGTSNAFTIDVNGNVTKVGNITGGGALTIASTGAGNDIIINGADILDIQDATTFASTVAFNSTTTFQNNDITDAEISDTLTASNFVGSGSTTNAIDLATAEVSGILGVTNGGTGSNTLNDLISLGTHTTGNYVATITNGSGISGSSSTEGGTPTIALGPLTSDWNQTGAFDISLNNASSELKILESAGATFFGILDVADLSASDKTYTFPNATGTVITTGNISDITGLTDAQISDTLTASNFVGSGSTTNAIDLATAEVNGTLAVGNGGTGATSFNTGGVLLGGATITDTGVLTNGQLLIGDGSGAPTLATLTQGTGISISNGAGSITINNSDLGSSQNIFKNFAVSGQNTVVTDANNDTLTLAAGSNITITTNDTTDTITIASADTTTEAQVEGWIFDTDNVAGATKITANANNIDIFSLQRQTDTSPTGNFLNFRNAANNSSLFTVDIAGNVSGGTINSAIISGGSLTASAVNGVTTANIVVTSGSYADPAWITSLAWSKITGTPTTLGGYGITDALSNSSSSTQDAHFGDIFLRDDTNSSHYLQITNGEDLTGARSLSIIVNDANRTLTISGNATVSGSNTGDQTITLTGDVTGSGTGSFATTIAADAVALTTDTTGNYVATITAGNGLTGDVSSEGSTPTLAVGAGTGILSNANDVAVDQSTNFAWTGIHSYTNTLTNTSSQTDFNLTLGNDADADTISAINIDVTSAATADADLVYGINIADLTTASAVVTETALRIGANWEQAIDANGTLISTAELSILDNNIALGTETTGNYVSDISGTTNQITASALTGSVTLSLPSDLRAPGTFNAVTSIATGVGAGTVRIDSSGNLTSIGNITGASGVTITSTVNTLTLDSGNSILTIAANDTTLQRTASGTYTINLIDGSNTTLALTNSGAGAANLSIDGLAGGGTQCLQVDNSGVVAATGTTCGTPGTLQQSYVSGNTITTTDADGDINFILADTSSDFNFNIDIEADNTVSISRVAGSSSESPTQLLLFENLDSDITLANGILFGTGAGTEVITDAIDLSDQDIVNALNIGQNTILASGTFTLDLKNSSDAILQIVNSDSGNAQVSIDSLAGGGVQCLQTDNVGVISGTGSACGSGGGSGDNIWVNGAAAADANFLDVAATGSVAGTTWTLVGASTPDDITLAISAASGSVAGVVTTGAQAFAGDKIFSGTITLANTGLHILDTNASHDLIFAVGSDLTADRTLTITTGDSDRTLTLTGNATISGTNTGDVTLAGENYLSIAGQVITANAVNLSNTNVTGTLAAARFGALTGDVTNSAGSYATTIAADAVALTTDTTGNYVLSITNGTGITGGNGGSEGATLTLAVDQAFSPTWTGVHTFTQTVTNTGFLTDFNLTLGNDGDADTVSAINIDVTSAATADADLVYGINIADLTTASAVVTETALRIGANWQNAIDANGTLITTTELGALAGGIDLTTETNGNYVATISGNSQVGVSGSGSEGATVSLSIVADSIGDTQLAFNTGQDLTSGSAVTFATVDTGQGANELYDMDQNVLTTSSVIFNDLTLTNTGLHVLDTDASHDLIFKPGSNLTADRTLTITTGDSDRTLTLSGNATISGTNTGDVTLAGENYLSIAGQVITANAVNLSNTNVTGTLAAARFGALTGDVTNSAGSYATTISADAVALTTDTTGNYVATITAGNGLTGDVSSEGSTPTLAVGAGTGILSNANDVAVDQSTNFAWTGIHSYTNTLTATSSQTDFNLTLGNDGDADTISAINIDVTSAATADADLVYGINIADLTTASAVVTETALRIGANWENALDLNGTLLTSAELAVLDGGIDVSTEVSGILPVLNGGTGANTLNNLITLGTHTTGNYVATIADSGAGTITVTGSGSETAGVTLGITNDSIGDTQLAFNTGQNLTTSSSVIFADLTLNNSGLHILDTNASHDLIFAVGSDLTADRTLTITTGDSDRTLTLNGNATISGTNTGDVTLAGENYLSIAGQVITANAVNLSNTNVTGTLAAARFGALTGDVTNSAGSYATTIAADAVALTTDTTGNYVLSITNGTGITGGNGGSEGATLTLAVDQAFSPTWTGVHTFTQTVTNTGFLTDFNLTLGNDGDADTISAINIDVTSAATADADLVYGINIADLTTASAVVTETALRIGANWQNAIDANGTLITTTELGALAGGIDLTTETNGNYVATISGNSQVGVSGSGSEGATVSLSIVADSIGDTQLAFNTGQDLTSGSAVTFATVDTGQGANELYDMDQNVLTTSSVIFNDLTLTNTGLHVLDTDASHDLIFKPGSNLTADRTLTITTGDSDRTLTLSGNATISGTNTGDVTLAGENYLSIAGQVITANAVNLSNTNVTGTLAAARFGALTGDVTNSAGSYATTISADAVALTTDTTGNYVATITAGNGLTGDVSSEGSTPTLAVGAGTGILSNANDVAVDQSTNFAWTGIHSYTNTLTATSSQTDFNLTLGNDGDADTSLCHKH
jgi:hypothetical protein